METMHYKNYLLLYVSVDTENDNLSKAVIGFESIEDAKQFAKDHNTQLQSFCRKNGKYTNIETRDDGYTAQEYAELNGLQVVDDLKEFIDILQKYNGAESCKAELEYINYVRKDLELGKKALLWDGKNPYRMRYIPSTLLSIVDNKENNVYEIGALI